MSEPPGLHASLAAFADPDLGPALVLDPAVGIGAVDRAMATVGLARDPDPGRAEPAALPLVASWSLRGGRPFAVWSFNPVADLRLLDVGLLPPPMRAAVAAALPLLTGARLQAMLADTEQRSVLRALWGLVALEHVEARPAVAALAAARSGQIGEAAARAAERLGGIERARLGVLAGLRSIAEAALPVIARLSDPQGLRALLAAPEDSAALFTDDIVGAVAEGLAASPFRPGRGVEPGAVDADDVAAAPAGLLRWHNGPSARFPRGYRLVAGWLLPEPVWLCWTVSTARGGRVSYDGLVFLGDRWLFCPRTFRLVEAALPRPQPRGTEG